MVRIRKNDGLCLAKSILLSIAHINQTDRKQWIALRKDSHNILTQKAKLLYENANIEFNENGVTIDAIDKIQKYLGDQYQIVALSAPDTIVYKGPYCSRQIYVLLNQDKNHADCLLSVKAFMKVKYFCKFCVKGFNRKYHHQCVHRCRYCFSNEKCKQLDSINFIKCDDCRRSFVSEECYNTHLKNKICSMRKRCENCNNIKQKNHTCYKKKCSICKEIVDISFHKCFVTPNNQRTITEDDKITKLYCFYDFETFIEPNESGLLHRVNQACSIICCDKCWLKEKMNKEISCNVCTGEMKSYFGIDSIEQFCNYLFKELDEKVKNLNSEKFKYNYRVIAHNGGKFDTHFIINYLLANRLKPNLIRKGHKILCMKIKNYKFIDSLSFLQMPLKNLPKSFGLDADHVCKGYFPHKFNKPENWNYDGLHPSIEFYDPDSFISHEERDNLFSWYDEVKDRPFNFKAEIRKYCMNDVIILMKCFMKFRNDWIENFKIDCISRCITLPQAVLEVFKTFYLPAKTIAIIPSNGYENKRTQSFIANLFLDYIEKILKIKLIREYKINRYFADGFCPQNNTVYEFFGCFSHGCKRCFKSPKRFLTMNPVYKISMDKLYQDSMSKIDFYKTKHYRICYIFECQFNELVKNDKLLNIFIKSRYQKIHEMKISPNLNPRQALFGGRCCPVKLYHKIQDDEKINYYDFCSLYPYCLKRYPYPLGHPIILNEFENNDISNYQGLIYCTVSPPFDLLFPILPSLINDKLVFTLCRTCADNMIENCDHTEDDRYLTGVWTHIELSKALERNYTIIKIYEIWHFENFTKMINGQNELFSAFINMCIKGKVESSSYPYYVQTEEDKKEYIQQYHDEEMVDLDSDQIKLNPGRRNINKLVVNCIWGKFAQNLELMRKSQFFSDGEKFLKIFNDDKYDIYDANIFNTDIAELVYREKTCFREEHSSSNVVLASFVTSYARLELYNILEKLGQRCLYYDTDSIFFVSKNCDWMPETGIFLGQLTDEEPGNSINEFISLGPKNYSYSLVNDLSGKIEYKIKLKGIRLNTEARKKINFGTMKNLLDNYIKESVDDRLTVPQTQFANTWDHLITMRQNSKEYKLVMSKRVVKSDYTTLPYGYKNSFLLGDNSVINDEYMD